MKRILILLCVLAIAASTGCSVHYGRGYNHHGHKPHPTHHPRHDRGPDHGRGHEGHHQARHDRPHGPGHLVSPQDERRGKSNAADRGTQRNRVKKSDRRG